MRTRKAIQNQIVAEWDAIVARARANPALGTYLPKSPKLFGNSHKVDLGRGFNVDTIVVYLPPADALFADEDTRTLCAFATLGCRLTCLGENSGLLITRTSAQARTWKGILYMGARALFRELLTCEALAHVARCERSGKLAALRVDGSSDTAEGAILAPHVPTAHVYDYTKNQRKALKFAAGSFAPNYHVTFSFSGENLAECAEVLAAGGNVAAVFDTPKGDDLPQGWLGAPVHDADAHDARFLDPAGPIVSGLRFKAARNRDAGLAQAGTFVVRTDILGQVALDDSGYPLYEGYA